MCSIHSLCIVSSHVFHKIHDDFFKAARKKFYISHVPIINSTRSMPSSCDCPIWYNESNATKAKDGIVRDIFRVCLYTSKHYIGFLLGVTALFLFIFPLFPQYVLNFRTKSAAGLSVWFVFLWLIGDTANMTSCVLTRQTPLQLYTAIYFVVSDIFLVAQVCWYEHLYSCRPRVSRVYYHVLEESEREEGEVENGEDIEMMNSESRLQTTTLSPSETLPETTPSSATSGLLFSSSSSSPFPPSRSLHTEDTTTVLFLSCQRKRNQARGENLSLALDASFEL